MFKINDYVMYGLNGACQITDIITLESDGSETEFFILHPVFNDNMTIRIPISNAGSLMRPITTREEISSLMTAMPTMETYLINNERERNTVLKAAIKTGDVYEWVKVVKTLYLDRQAKTAVNKKVSKTDENLMDAAERQLNEEFAVALNMSPSEVGHYIEQNIVEN